MRKAREYEKAGMGLQYNYGQQAAEGQTEGGATEPNPTRDN